MTSRLAPRFLFGTVKEIVLIRDPRDLLCSFESYWKFSGDLAIESIANTLDAMATIRQEQRNDLIFVKFEDLVLQTTTTLSQRASFLEVDGGLDSNILNDAFRFKGHGTTESPEASIGRWKRDLKESQIEQCLPKFAGYLKTFDYEV